MSAPSLPRDLPRGRRVDAVVATLVNTLPSTGRAAGAGLATVLAVLVLLIPVGAVAQIVLTSQLDDRSPTQALVVLDPASRTWGDPAPILQARLDHAAELYREGIAPVVLITGPHRSAAASTAALERAGVPARDIVAIGTGSDTVGALQVVASVLRGLGWSSVTLVTDPTHAARAASTAGGFGIDAHVSPTDAGPGASLTSDSVARETAALLRYHLLTRWQQPTIIR